MPIRSTRRWPHTSPARPNAGAAMPKASSGPVITHVSVFSVVPSSRGDPRQGDGEDVKVTLTEKSPASTVHRTHQR